MGWMAKTGMRIRSLEAKRSSNLEVKVLDGQPICILNPTRKIPEIVMRGTDWERKRMKILCVLFLGVM